MIGHCLDPQGDHAAQITDEELRRVLDGQGDHLPKITVADLRRALQDAARMNPHGSTAEIAESAIHIARVRRIAENNAHARELLRRARIGDLHETAAALTRGWLGSLDANDVAHWEQEAFERLVGELAERAFSAASVIQMVADRYDGEN